MSSPSTSTHANVIDENDDHLRKTLNLFILSSCDIALHPCLIYELERMDRSPINPILEATRPVTNLFHPLEILSQHLRHTMQRTVDDLRTAQSIPAPAPDFLLSQFKNEQGVVHGSAVHSCRRTPFTASVNARDRLEKGALTARDEYLRKRRVFGDDGCHTGMGGLAFPPGIKFPCLVSLQDGMANELRSLAR